jgi:hypothetical protein
MEVIVISKLFRNVGILLILAIWPKSLPALDNNFEIVERGKEIYGIHSGFLGLVPFAMPDGKFQYWVRQRFPKTPGDYFRWPEGADTTSLNEPEYAEIRKTIRETVDSAYYNDFMLTNMNGYEYTIGEGSSEGPVHRREYHIYYARGDTIYVISGWLGKFLSFYRAVPGEFRYEVDELKKQVNKLSASYRIADKNSLKRVDDKGNYLLEYVDRENMMRVRNHLIYGTFIFPGTEKGVSKLYNLIEITKFIDPEVIP